MAFIDHLLEERDHAAQMTRRFEFMLATSENAREQSELRQKLAYFQATYADRDSRVEKLRNLRRCEPQRIADRIRRYR